MEKGLNDYLMPQNKLIFISLAFLITHAIAIT